MSNARSAAPWALAFLSFVAFIALGMPDGLLGVAWPSMRTTFGQDLDALALLLAGGTTGYLISSFGNGWLMARLGVGRLLGFSAIITALALGGYTICPWWPAMFGLALLAGLGAGGIDAGLNAWVEAHLSPRVMQWLHASFGIGITMGPVIMTVGIASTGAWQPGYWVVGAIQLLLGLLFVFMARIWDNAPKAEHYHAEVDSAEPHHSYGATLRNPLSWLSASLFFVYVGVELGMGHWAYTFISAELGLEGTLAGIWTGAYWASFTLGRFIAGFVAHKTGPAKLLSMALAGLVVVTLFLALVPGTAFKIAGIVALGFIIAPIFPSMVSTTSQRVGRKHAGTTIGMQMAMAGLGVGVVPGIMGTIAKNWGLDLIPWMIAATALILVALSLVFSLRKETRS